MFKGFCSTWDIQHVLIVAGSPQVNRQVERYNRTIKALLSKMMHEEGKNRTTFLSKIQFCINHAFNRIMKNTPDNILFSLNQHGETNDYLRLVMEFQNNINSNDRNLMKIRDIAQDNTINTQLKNKSYIDKSH